MNSALSCCRKQKKFEQQQKFESGLFLKMQSDSLPAGGTVRAATAGIKAALLMNATLSDQMKMSSKLF